MTYTDEQLATLEAILFIHGEPIAMEKIGRLMSLADEETRGVVEELQKRLASRERGLAVVTGSDKVQLATKPQFSKLVEQFVKAELSEDLSPASLETLSIVSYFGPISRSRIDYQRGVNSSFILRSLLLRGLVDRRLDPMHSNTYLYTPSFETLKYLGVEGERSAELRAFSNAPRQVRIPRITSRQRWRNPKSLTPACRQAGLNPKSYHMTTTIEKIALLIVVVALVIVGGRFGFAGESTRPALITEQLSNLNNQPILASPSPKPPMFALSVPAVAPAEKKSETTSELDELLRALAATSSSVLVATNPLPMPPPTRDAVNQTPAPGEKIQTGSLSASETIRTAAFRPIGTVEDPPVESEAALVADLQTGEIYFDHGANRRWPIASITKLMTAVVALETVNQDDVVALGEDDFPVGDSSIAKSVIAGESYAVKDLITTMLVVSSNAAAEAVANHVGRAEFLRRMNATAAAWGMHDTYFADPTGLSSADQSTALDLRRLALKIYEAHPEIFQTTRKLKVTIYEASSKKKQTLQNINQFAGEPWFVGGKTGYTDDANGNLLTVFTQDRRPVIAVVLGTADRFGETDKLMTWFGKNYRIASAK